MDDPHLFGRRFTTLDTAVLELARRVLPEAEGPVFYLAYKCKDSWGQVASAHEKFLGKKLKVRTVKKYGSSAVKRILAHASLAGELRAWEKEYRSRFPDRAKGQMWNVTPN